MQQVYTAPLKVQAELALRIQALVLEAHPVHARLAGGAESRVERNPQASFPDRLGGPSHPANTTRLDLRGAGSVVEQFRHFYTGKGRGIRSSSGS